VLLVEPEAVEQAEMQTLEAVLQAALVVLILVVAQAVQVQAELLKSLHLTVVPA
jgi:hypothetical protein